MLASPCKVEKQTFIDSYSQVVWDIVFANIENRICGDPASSTSRHAARRRPALLVSSILHIVVHHVAKVVVGCDDLGICIDGVELLAVLVGDGKEFATDLEEIVLVEEEELKVFSSVA